MLVETAHLQVSADEGGECAPSATFDEEVTATSGDGRKVIDLHVFLSISNSRKVEETLTDPATTPSLSPQGEDCPATQSIEERTRSESPCSQTALKVSKDCYSMVRRLTCHLRLRIRKHLTKAEAR